MTDVKPMHFEEVEVFNGEASVFAPLEYGLFYKKDDAIKLAKTLRKLYGWR